ncbi:MAG TPA: MbnP family protein [Cytophagaceae bacterium]|jgi:hypothetical protein|nr:MbnP family protein [Cytophagaceae bacterium]
MKNLFKENIAFSVLTICTVLYLSSCGKKSDDASPSTPTGTLQFHLHTNVDTNEVGDFNTVYSIPVPGSATARRNISVSAAELYISNIQLVRSDGSLYNVSNEIVLKVQPIEPYTIGNVPAGNYKSVRFYVGLDPTTDKRVLVLPADSVLNHSEMWFGSAATNGHLFINFQGSIDTTTVASGSSMTPFSFKLGTNKNYQPVIVTQSFTVSPNQTQFVHMIVDYSKLFTSVTLNNANNINISSHTDSTSNNAIQISNNISSMFRNEY